MLRLKFAQCRNTGPGLQHQHKNTGDYNKMAFIQSCGLIPAATDCAQ